MSSPGAVGPETRGALVNILAWFWMVASCMAVVARLATKYVVVRKFGVDDGWEWPRRGQRRAVGITISFISKGIQCFYIQPRTLIHLGTELTVRYKSFYTAGILWIASECASKVSMVFLIKNLFNLGAQKLETLVFIASMVLWATASILVVIFECHVPYVWNFLGDQCINQTVFWNFTNAVNILLDISLILVPIIYMWQVQVSFRRKAVVIGCFATRVFNIAAIAWQIVELNRASNASNTTYALWSVATAMSLTQCLSIVTACIPYLKPFYQSLESGMIRSDDMRRRGGTFRGGYYYNSEGGHSQGSTWGQNVLKNMSDRHSKPHELQSITSITALNTATKYHQFDQETQASRSRTIQETRTFTVEEVTTHE
ncbi:hypothetical protein UA08_06899 [Talaromyces atroroseus]|uniref:Rhodopsin domain-containing protein n=1 Tax=Talaromyces atroroseus TaxID=1441469 RepID=A0A225AW34_TALAT|nr:hypothetical protein UA08_06899 [Talaromyces atroroseus]OKL57707.1 hypothetical protein UA08_06899 [Talaromyces atroroseus]